MGPQFHYCKKTFSHFKERKHQNKEQKLMNIYQSPAIGGFSGDEGNLATLLNQQNLLPSGTNMLQFDTSISSPFGEEKGLIQILNGIKSCYNASFCCSVGSDFSTPLCQKCILNLIIFFTNSQEMGRITRQSKHITHPSEIKMIRRILKLPRKVNGTFELSLSHSIIGQS